MLPDQVGGRLALDFVNTVWPRNATSRTDRLATDGGLLDWARAVGCAGPSRIEHLTAVAAADRDAANAAVRRVIAYREALHRVFVAALAGRAVAGPDLTRVNAVLREATDHHVLLPGEFGGVRDGWLAGDGLDALLWPVAIDAWDLLTEPVLGRVRQCPGDDGACGRLFLDTSRSGTRRWCDMRTCGNRAKARAHYTRVRG